VHAGPDPDSNGLLVLGIATNNSGTTQAVDKVTGIFYDAQGQAIAGEADVISDWPTDVVPAGGTLPFVARVGTISSAASYQLRVDAAPSDQTPRQDFEFSNEADQMDDEDYCVTANVRNPGAALDEYLVIAAVLYDSQNNVVNFDYSRISRLGAGAILNFELCIPPPNQGLAREELIAWGR
jgi:hypothetical protein